MKTDIIVQRAKTVINDLGLIQRIDYLKEYKNINQSDRYKESYLKRYILSLAEDQKQMNYLFIEKVLKQINLMLL
jgi:hypothetical protein